MHACVRASQRYSTHMPVSQLGSNVSPRRWRQDGVCRPACEGPVHPLARVDCLQAPIHQHPLALLGRRSQPPGWLRKHTHRVHAHNTHPARPTHAGANANAVKELVICGLLLASRGIVEGHKHTVDKIYKEENVSACNGPAYPAYSARLLSM